MTQQEFAQKIKQKYPQYQAVDDATLVTRILNKYPQYKVQIDQVSPMGFVNNLGSSAVQNAKDIGSALINVFNPNMEENTVANMGRLGAGTLQYLDPTQGNQIANPLIKGGQFILNPIGTARDNKPVENYEPIAGAVGNFYKDRYGSPEAIGNTLYNDPVGVALDASTLFSAGSGLLKSGGSLANATGKVGTAGKLSKASNIAGKAAEFTDPISLITKPGSKVFSKINAADKIAEKGTDLRVRSAGVTSPQAKRFKDVTGTNIGEFMRKENFSGRGVDAVSNKIADVSDRYNALARNTNKVVSLDDITTMFNDAATPYLSKPVLTSEDVKILDKIMKEYQLVLKQTELNGGSIPLSSITENKSSYFKQSRGMRGTAPSKANALEDVAQASRGTIEKYAPETSKLGKQEQKLMEYEKIAEANATKGSTGNLFKLPSGAAMTAGGILGGIPGAAGAWVSERIINSPRTTAAIGKGLEKLGTSNPAKIAQPTYQTGRTMSRLDVGTQQQPQQPTTKPFTPKPTMPNTPVFKKKQNIKMPSLNLAPY